MDENWLEMVLTRYQGDGLLSNILDLRCTPAVPKGENYLSIVTRVSSKVMLKSGRKANVSLIVKAFPDGAETQKFLKESSVFEQEVNVYLMVLKEMENLMCEQDDVADKLWADLVGFRPYDTIIFKDLGAKNFRILPRRGCQDLSHGMLAVAELGRFHAMGKILLSRGLIRREDYGPYLFAKDEKTYMIIEGSSIIRMGEIIEESWGPEWVDVGRRLKNCAKPIGKTYIKLPGSANEKFQVFNHGDPWTNNMMYKHTSFDNRPIALRFIDFQLSHVDSFAWDLTYFIFSSVEPSLRRENYKLLVKTYHDSLQNSLLKMGMQTKDVPTHQEVLDEMERLIPFRVMVLCFFHVIMTAEREDAFSFETALNIEEGDDFVPPKDECFRDELFKSRIGPDIAEFARIGLI